MVRDTMMQRNIGKPDAIRAAYAALQAGRFAAARDSAAPWVHDAAGALLHALGQAGAGDAEGAAPTLAAIARSNPGARHPVSDLADLLRPHRLPILPHLRAALLHRPDDPALLELLGLALTETGPMEEAIATHRRAAALAPTAGAFSNLGKSLAAEGRFEEADAAFARALALRPDVQVRLNHAIAQLKSGRLAEGWELFRIRRNLPGYPSRPGPELRSLEGIAGRTVLLVHSEGFGDTLQFIRYARLLAAQGARVLVDAPPALAALLAHNGLDLARDAQHYDAWTLIPDLPGLFGTTLDTIPAQLPYLQADPTRASIWAETLATRLSPGRRVGLVWSGAPRADDPAAAATDRLRSIPAALLPPLLATPGITWISLQYRTPPPPGLFDPMPAVRDFADTAAIIANLDTVLSVDTAVAHLAAAMGKPTLLLDRYDACWRWLHNRTDSPWYPTAIRIIRQQTPGDWPGVLQSAASHLATGFPLPRGEG